MSENDHQDTGRLEEMVDEIVARLQRRRVQIAEAIYDIIRENVPNPKTDDDTEYQTGTLAAIAEELDYTLASVKQVQDWSAPLPRASTAQARRAARAGVGLGTVLRRYAAAHKAMGDLILHEADSSGPAGYASAVQYIHRRQGDLLERSMAAIEQEYNQEQDRLSCSPQHRCLAIAQRLLSHDPEDPAELFELNYELYDTWHVGIIATGVKVEEVLKRLKTGLECVLLLVAPKDDMWWAWLGRPTKLATADIERTLSLRTTSDISLVLGEPREGLAGWRLSHQEALVASRVAINRRSTLTRCADVPLEAAVLQTSALASLLVETYLRPLEHVRNGGKVLRKTLRAYLAVGCNAATAAAMLGVDRHTVERHVHTAEDRLGRPLRTCLPELHIALRLEELL